MGLLDDLLGGIASQQTAGRMPQQQPMGAQAGGGSMGSILMALMPVVLSMLSSQGARRGMPGQMSAAPGAGGGLGDILGQVLGGAAGGGGAGGLGSILAQLQQAGFGKEADSWVGTGANKPIPPDAMTQIFGRDGLQQISRHAGLSEEETSRGLSQLLPEVVDRVTPGGEVPDFDALSNSVDDLARRFGAG